MFEEQVTAKHLSQRFASPEVDSPEAFQTARGWIEDCFKNHDECPKPSEESRLPTRVLDIFSSFDTGKVRLHVSNSHDVGKTYAALSYCWGSTRRGSTRQTLLTCSNLDAFAIAGIAIASLPQTLQDAILVARQLKIPYLWIDSLCIIQDSEHDKAIEIAAMPQIYKEAVVTISAASASDCGEGFLSTRQDIRGFRDLSLILPWSMNAEKHENMSIDEILESAKGTDDIDAVFVTMDETCGFGNKPFAREVISKRAWTLQEGWLSSRLLIYGKGYVNFHPNHLVSLLKT